MMPRPDDRIALPKRTLVTGAGMLLALLAAFPGKAVEPEDHTGLTRASYRRNCLLCHHSAAPEGISPEIMAGLHPVPGLKPRDAMPGIECWRRCEACKRPEPKPGE
jgi:hypothetical protein